MERQRRRPGQPCWARSFADNQKTLRHLSETVKLKPAGGQSCDRLDGVKKEDTLMAKRKAPRSTTRKAAGRRPARGKARAAKARKGAAGRRKSARKTSASAASSRRTTRARKKATGPKTTPARKTAARRIPPRPRPAAATGKAPARKPAALERERRTVADEDLIPTPPSSLDLDRSASAIRTGRRELKERYDSHTETSPALTGGDVDADWESAYSVGDEAPGGDNPTPDQDIVDDIGRAVGIEYQDTEELKGADKLEQRDRRRWELDPASSEDWNER